METLSIYSVFPSLHRSQELEAHFHTKNLNRRHHKWLEFLSGYDTDIAYLTDKVNVVEDALSKGSVACGYRLAAMGIWYADQREEVENRHLVEGLMRLTIGLTIADCIRQMINNPSSSMHKGNFSGWSKMQMACIG